MTIKYTPGPWEAYRTRVEIPGDGVAYLLGANAEANAHLSAAAPDLLEALREAIRYVPYERWEGMTPDDEAKMEKTWKKIRAALAKAEGKEVK